MGRGTQCQGCGTPVPDDSPRTPCPQCGCTLRLHTIELQDGVVLYSSLKGRHKDRSGFTKYEFLAKTKKAGQSGRTAEEFQSYDRTHPDHSMKRHQVWEIGEDGEKMLVHDEECISPAKRRPTKPSDPSEESPDKVIGQEGDE
jgi:hypothetical protein